MPRPVKWRRVEYIPETNYFAPCPQVKCACLEEVEEVQLKVEELEAMRLKDIEELSQEECALKMQISRQTFQNIIDQARKKVVTALIEKQAITVGGGHYTRNICKFHCCDCGTEMLATYEENGPVCPSCGSTNVVCSRRQCCESFCEK